MKVLGSFLLSVLSVFALYAGEPVFSSVTYTSVSDISISETDALSTCHSLSNDALFSNAVQTGVFVYDQCEFRGKQTSLAEGDHPNTRTLGIAALQIPAGYELTIYLQENFKGTSLKLTENRACLPNAWRFKIRSLQVRKIMSIDRPTPMPTSPDAQLTHVEVYSECQYTGKKLLLSPGQHGNLSRHSISSVKIPEGQSVILYTGNNFTGQSMTLTSSNSCFPRAWNNRVGSLVIQRESANLDRVQFYSGCQYTGSTVSLGDGNHASLPGGLEGKVSSIRIPEGKWIEVYDGRDFRGSKLIFNNNMDCLSKDWNDRIRSVKIMDKP